MSNLDRKIFDVEQRIAIYENEYDNHETATEDKKELRRLIHTSRETLNIYLDERTASQATHTGYNINYFLRNNMQNDNDE